MEFKADLEQRDKEESANTLRIKILEDELKEQEALRLKRLNQGQQTSTLQINNASVNAMTEEVVSPRNSLRANQKVAEMELNVLIE